MAKAKATKTASKKPAAKKTATKKAATKKPAAKKPAKAVKPTLTPEQVEANKIATAEANLVEKHGSKIVVGSVRRAPAGSKYGSKMMVTINTVGVDGTPDGQTREVATSDVHQVHHTDEVRKELAKQRAADKRAAAKPAATEAVDLDAIEASL